MRDTTERQPLSNLPLRGPNSFRHIENYAGRVKAAIRANAVTVAFFGTDEAAAELLDHATDALVGPVWGEDREEARQEARALLIDAVYSHNIRHGYYDFCHRNPWLEVEV